MKSQSAAHFQAFKLTDSCLAMWVDFYLTSAAQKITRYRLYVIKTRLGKATNSTKIELSQQQNVSQVI